MRDRLNGFAALVLFVVVATVAVACGGGGAGIGATLKDFSITLDKSSAEAGDVTFKIKNNGPSQHEFVVFKTDLAPGQLPTKTENGVQIVDEEGQGVTAVDEKEDINPNTSTELKVNLAAGKYVIICNLPAHYQQGMRTGFTVTGS